MKQFHIDASTAWRRGTTGEKGVQRTSGMVQGHYEKGTRLVKGSALPVVLNTIPFWTTCGACACYAGNIGWSAKSGMAIQLFAQSRQDLHRGVHLHPLQASGPRTHCLPFQPLLGGGRSGEHFEPLSTTLTPSPPAIAPLAFLFSRTSSTAARTLATLTRNVVAVKLPPGSCCSMLLRRLSRSGGAREAHDG